MIEFQRKIEQMLVFIFLSLFDFYYKLRAKDRTVTLSHPLTSWDCCVHVPLSDAHGGWPCCKEYGREKEVFVYDLKLRRISVVNVFKKWGKIRRGEIFFPTTAEKSSSRPTPSSSSSSNDGKSSSRPTPSIIITTHFHPFRIFVSCV